MTTLPIDTKTIQKKKNRNQSTTKISKQEITQQPNEWNIHKKLKT